MTTTLVDGIAVETAGEGTPVIMVHGLGGSSNTFQPLMSALQNHRVIRPDLPGAARSGLPSGSLSIAAFAEAILRVAAEFGVERAHFVGHSMGTLVCQHIAAERPDLVASLALFGPILEPSEQMRTGLAGRARLARTEGMAPIADQIIVGGLSPQTKASQPAAVAFVRESIMRQDAEGYARHCEALAAARAVDHARITAPTLLVTGESDGTAPPASVQALGERIKGAELRILEGSGHWATIEKPAECAATLTEFLGRQP